MSKKLNNPQDQMLSAYDAYADAIYRHCYYRLFNKDLAEDFTQEIFLRLFEYYNKGNEIKYIQSFLYKTANNLIIDYVRKIKETSLDQMMENGFDPSKKMDDTLVNNIDAGMILEVMKQVDEMYRVPVLMRYVDGLKPKEIARILGESENIVSVRIYRGVKMVKEILKKKEGGGALELQV